MSKKGISILRILAGLVLIGMLLDYTFPSEFSAYEVGRLVIRSLLAFAGVVQIWQGYKGLTTKENT